MAVEKLAGGDCRSIGAADAVAQEIAGDQALFDEVLAALYSDDPVLRMRAADALEKASRKHPERLRPHKDAFLGELAEIEQQEVRWHLAQMLPRLPMDRAEKARAVEILETFLKDKSTIVRVNALEALVQLARGEAALEAKARRRLADAMEKGRPAEKARARKLLDHI
ncbi:MAG: hypothetical protein BAA04_09495 [Firmicutes bacterium ZCTH02-B6]|nr:MAG: hypothetical protein BAA04_09495 [Firmicutes bacterium ZCTH02-B6]